MLIRTKSDGKTTDGDGKSTEYDKYLYFLIYMILYIYKYAYLLISEEEEASV